ncbi:fasciclin domain-containing protein [Patescibacteria group bacterium]|nr:fasciclin domain-containing protein [Patescibacteria group bacterium]
MNKTAITVIIIVIVIVIAIIGLVYWQSNNNGTLANNTASSTYDQTQAQPIQQGVLVGGAYMTPDRDIVQNAMNASNVTTLVAAVSAAGLAPTLEGVGPFTVFAPNNDAFAKLPAGTVQTLLKPENKAKLADILTYHVVAGRYTAADLHDGQVLTSVEGKPLTIGKSATGQITVNGTATVETPDVISSNGVTFVIDSVLTLPAK